MMCEGESQDVSEFGGADHYITRCKHGYRREYMTSNTASNSVPSAIITHFYVAHDLLFLLFRRDEVDMIYP